MRSSFSISQIKRAFWKEYHKSGETFFPYNNDDEEDNERTTEAEFEGLLHSLNEIADQDEKDIIAFILAKGVN